MEKSRLIPGQRGRSAAVFIKAETPNLNGRNRDMVGRQAESGYTVAEVVVAVLMLGMLTVTLFAAFSSGLALVQLARENLRATQILTQKMEAIRLLTWLELPNPAYATPTFTDWYDPRGTNSETQGITYQGFVSVDPAPAGLPSDMRQVTVTIYWTNYLRESTTPIVRSRQMQTYVARYGMQSYVYQ